MVATLDVKDEKLGAAGGEGPVTEVTAAPTLVEVDEDKQWVSSARVCADAQGAAP